MEKQSLIIPRVVFPDGHFTPLVFVDLSIPTAVIVGGCTYVGREISKEVKDDKMVNPETCLSVIKDNFFPMKISSSLERMLVASIDDIRF